jgi:amino acid permease
VAIDALACERELLYSMAPHRQDVHIEKGYPTKFGTSGIVELPPKMDEPESESLSTSSVTTTTMQEATINLICGGLGTGMFSLPWTMAGASVLPGVLTIFAVIAINIVTIAILVEAAERHKAFDLGALLRKLPGHLGPLAQYVTNASIWFSMILTLIGYIIVIRDSALPLVGHSWLSHGRAPLTTLAALLVLPLCFVDQKYLSFSSVIAVLVNINLLVVVVLLLRERADSHEISNDSCIFGVAKGSLTMVSTVSNSIIIQMCVLPMYEVLEHRSPAKFIRVVLVAFGCLALLLSLFCVVAYLAVGGNVQGNVLLDLPHTKWNSVSRAGIIAVILAVYPIMLMPMVAPLRSVDPFLFLRPGTMDERSVLREGNREQLTVLAVKRRTAFVSSVTVGIILFSFLGAMMFDDLGPLNAFNGALCVGVFTSLGPGLVGLFLVGRTSMQWRIGMGSLLMFGAVMMVLGFVYSDNNFHANLSRVCQWHLGSSSSSTKSKGSI